MAACGGGGGGSSEPPEATAQEVLDRFPAAPNRPLKWSYQANLTLGVDNGRALGTLFELVTKDGDLLAAAGFANGMQTTASNDGRMINFFVGGNGDPESRFPALPAALARPFGPTELFSMTTYRGQLLAYRYHRPGVVRTWDEARQAWVAFTHRATDDSSQRSIRNIQTVDNRLLVIYDDAIRYGNRVVSLEPLALPDLAIISMGLFAAGHMSLSVVDKDHLGELRAGVAVCSWSPDDAVLKGCRLNVHPTGPTGTTLERLPSGLHVTSAGALLTYGLQGDVFALEGGTWTAVREGLPSESWQAYSSLDAAADVVLGHYPSANLFSIGRNNRGREWSIAEQQPGVVPPNGVRRDELQSVMHFGGELLAGVWPWGEIFRGRRDGDWNKFIEAFSRAGGEPDHRHPFESVVGNNCLGQRVFQILPWRNGFVFSTTLKNEDDECAKASAALTPAQLDEYGRVYYVERTNALACPFVWFGRASRLNFGLTDDNRLFVSQDGRQLCSATLSSDAMATRLQRSDNRLAVDALAVLSKASGLYGPTLR